MVRKLLEERGIATISADTIGHEILRSDGPAFHDVASRWPSVVRDGEIDRAALAAIVFNDRLELVDLEAATHPHIFDRIERMVKGTESAVVVEIPILRHRLGEGWERIVVDCRDQTRLIRAMGRGLSEIEARARMGVQPSRSAWLAAADVVVPNHGSIEELRGAVSSLVDAWEFSASYGS